MSDPLRILWDDLASGGYGPLGKSENFYSRCPGHDGDGRSLHVSRGASGEALLWCFAHGCSVQDIIEPLSLRVADLFPADNHYRGRLKNARREDFTGNYRIAANVLLASQRLGLRCRIEIKLDECPDCESPRAALVIDSTGEPFAHCQRGCGVQAFTGGLAERLRGQR